MSLVHEIEETNRVVVETHVNEKKVRRVYEGREYVYRYGFVYVVVPEAWIGRKVRVTVELLGEGYGV